MEDRNDPLVQKMRRYINALSRDDESSKKAENVKSSTTNDPLSNNKSTRCWQIIRQSIECEKEENVDSPDTKVA